MDEFTYNTLHDYWDPERKWVDEEYITIPFPFKEVEHPEFSIQVNWSFEHAIGYFNSWSSVQHYIRKHGTNPVNFLATQLKPYWKGKNTMLLDIPLFLRIGHVCK